jgi:hypothetical protein
MENIYLSKYELNTCLLAFYSQAHLQFIKMCIFAIKLEITIPNTKFDNDLHRLIDFILMSEKNLKLNHFIFNLVLFVNLIEPHL